MPFPANERASVKVSPDWFKPAEVSPTPLPPDARSGFEPMSSMNFVKPMQGAQPGGREPFVVGAPPPVGRQNPSAPAQPAPRGRGFYKVATQHFDLYMENSPPPLSLVATLENIHANLMIDLQPFVEKNTGPKVSIFIFKNKDTYREVTGRPEWSGGATSVPERKIYIYESRGFTGILAHEMCHVYYDGFYIGGKDDPLWLSEGMATFIQVERGLSAPNWLKPNLDILSGGGGFPLNDLMDVTTTVNDTDSQVELWYTQSYSLVRYLLKTGHKSNFYNFSNFVRQGQSVPQALLSAYGKPFDGVKSLEYAWRYNLARRSVGNL
jgi:hypothetical protein